MKIQEVWDCYSDQLASVEERLFRDLESPVAQIPAVGRYLIGSGGKRLRPVLVILGAEMAGYAGNNIPVLGSIVETIHTASLLHDDIVDDATIRRGKPTAHSVWGNEIIVLVGDFMYSNALRIAVSLKNQRVMDVLSEATTRMTEAELLQLSKIGDPTITEDDYLKIISGKTAALISAACRLGAILAGRPAEDEEAMAGFGTRLGAAFQIADDLLDYKADAGKLGKSLGKDLEEGKLTLPVILLLGQASEEEREEVRRIIVAESLEEADLARMMELFAGYGTLNIALARAEAIMGEAKSMIVERFPESRARRALLAIADYALYRER